MTPRMFALGGADNVGKSTQLVWLAKTVPGLSTLPGVHHFDPRWSGVINSSPDWWFERASTIEHVALMMDSATARYRVASKVAVDAVVVTDRGWQTLIAACAATAMVKENLAARDAIDLVRRLAPKIPDEEEILLRLSSTPDTQAARSIERERASVDDRYRRYQSYLAEVLSVLVSDGCFAHVIDCGDQSVLDIQNEIRSVLVASSEGRLVARPLGTTMKQVWALGGLSEAGKSTAGDHLRRTRSFTRLKMAYLIESGALREEYRTPYELSEADLAGVLARELLRFAEAHTDQHHFVIESVHRVGVARALRAIFGDRIKIIYLDVPLPIRASRSLVTPAEFVGHDVLKQSRGAHDVRGVAHAVVDNAGSQLGLRATCDSMQSLSPHPLTTVNVSSFMLPEVVLGSLSRIAETLGSLDGVELVALTGSTSSQSWCAGWSDIDLLVVARNELTELVDNTVQRVSAGLSGTSVTVTHLSPEEVEARWVPARVVHALYLLQTGTRSALYVSPNWRPPLLSRNADLDASLGDFPVIAFRLRRLRARYGSPAFNLRGLYKHVVLFLKLALRLEGIEVESAADVLRASVKLSGLAIPQLPPPSGIVDASELVCRQTVAATDAILEWYVQQFRMRQDAPRAR